MFGFGTRKPPPIPDRTRVVGIDLTASRARAVVLAAGRTRAILLDDPEPFDAPEHDVVPAVLQPLGVRDDAAAANRIHRRLPLVIALPAGFQKHHAEHSIAGERVPDHLAIARLEDMERQEHVRKKDDVGKREEG